MQTVLSTNNREGSKAMKSSGDGAPDIPAAAKKVVQNLKEIVKNHSDEEIYATLKDCGMDPNHAVYILLNQDTFHEVRRKRDKRRENGLNNAKEETKSRSMVASSQRLDASGTKVNYVPRHSQSGTSGVGNQKLTNAGEDGGRQAYKDASTTSQPASLARSKTWRIRLNTGPRGMGQRVSSQTNAQFQRYSRRGPRVSGYTISSMQKRPPNSNVAAKMQEVAAPQADGAKKEGGGGHGNEVGPADVSLLKSIRKSFPSASPRNMVSEAKNLPGRFREISRPYAAQTKSSNATGWAGPYSQTYYRTKAPHQILPGTQRVPNGLAWKPKPSTVPATAGQGSHGATENIGGLPSPQIDEVPRETVSKLEGLKLQDERPVIIPEHLQVPEAECAGLNFGSFDTGFEPRLNETKSLTSEIPISSEVRPVHQIEASVAESPLVQTSTPSHSQLLSPAPAETFATTSDAVLSLSAVAPVRSPEITKPEVPAEQGRQFSPAPSVTTYQGLGSIPQPPYMYDVAESQPQEIPRAANVVQPPLADAAPNYYGPVFRPGSDVETRYPFLSSHGASKFSGNVPLMNGQTLPPSQEPSQNAGTTLAVGQPPSIPVHAYAAQPANVSMPPYAYGYHPYVPSNYAYVHAPYGTSGYPQPPVGSSFASGARGYPSTGTAPIKYPPSQYKLGAGNSPHAVVAAAYGNYGTTFSGFAAMNSAVSAGSGSNYDNMAGSHYKENTLFPPSHQVEGSALWVQGPLSRDVSGIQANSYYNLQGQGQHGGYTPSQPAHVAGFAGYNSQSTPGPNPHHQVLQQPQAVGSLGAAAGSQGAVIFSQPQRGPVNWASSYSNLLRGQ